MNAPCRVVLALAFVAVALVTSPPRSHAAWLLGGNPVCTEAGAQNNARCAPDGSGGAVILWTDERRGAGLVDLYGTRILGDGTIAPGWPANGVALTTSGRARSHSIVEDGAGGLLAFWLEDLDGVDDQVWLQHVDASGSLAPGFGTSGNALPITVGGPSGWVVQAVTDGAGGAYLMWNHWNGYADGLYITRLDGSGTFAPGWSSSGVLQATSDQFNMFNGFTTMILGPDPSGGALTGFLLHVEDFPTGGHIAGGFTRTGPNGGVAFFGSAPSPPSLGPQISLVADGAGGMFASWASTTRRMQHFLANGSRAWPEPTEAPWNDRLLRDGSGGIYLFGRASSPDQLELHRRASDASIPSPWTSSGVVVSNAGSFSAFDAVRSGSLVYAAWSNGPAGANDIRACAVTPDGAIAPGWTANGIVISDAANSQLVTSMIPLPPEDALVAWADLRSGAPDVYAALLKPAGPPPLAVPPLSPGGIALALAPNPASGRAQASLTLPEAGPAALEVVDLAGRVLVRLEVLPSGGPQSLALDTAPLPAGLYWARVQQGARIAALRFAVVH